MSFFNQPEPTSDEQHQAVRDRVTSRGEKYIKAKARDMQKTTERVGAEKALNRHGWGGPVAAALLLVLVGIAIFGDRIILRAPSNRLTDLAGVARSWGWVFTASIVCFEALASARFQRARRAARVPGGSQSSVWAWGFAAGVPVAIVVGVSVIMVAASPNPPLVTDALIGFAILSTLAHVGLVCGPDAIAVLEWAFDRFNVAWCRFWSAMADRSLRAAREALAVDWGYYVDFLDHAFRDAGVSRRRAGPFSRDVLGALIEVMGEPEIRTVEISVEPDELGLGGTAAALPPGDPTLPGSSGAPIPRVPEPTADQQEEESLAS